MAKSNLRIDQIEARNDAMYAATENFRAQLRAGTATVADVPKLKQQFPAFGIMPLRAADIDFAMFHAHDDVIVWEYLWHGADGYEGKMVREWVNWCRTTPGEILDIGGYTGLMSILAALAHPDNRVHLFEPLERTIERASINLKINEVANRVKRHAVAASDQDGTAEIHLYRDDDFLGPGNSIDLKKGKAALNAKVIKTVKVDDYLPDVRPTVIKIDVEGHELACLHGLEKTITRSRPKMLIESWADTRTAVKDLLTRHGYVLERAEAADYPVNNYIALPRA